MDTPHNDKQRKSLFPYKLAQTLVGLIAVCFLIFCIRSPSTSSPSPFQTTPSEKETALKWIFITPYGETDSSYADLFLSPKRIAPNWPEHLWNAPFAPLKNI